MNRILVGTILGVLWLAGAHADIAWGDDLKTIKTRKTKDVVITLRSESGQWTQGKNAFVLEFTSPLSPQGVDAGQAALVDVGQVTLSTVMPMPGMAPMLAGATLTPDKVAGRYLGTISFPDRGARQVTVTWDGPAGKGSTRFSVPVR
jgi:hypothetical protein